MTSLPQATLDELDLAVQHMLRTGEREGIEIIGAGAISCVIGLGDHALKRLPPVAERARLEAYGELLEAYLSELRIAGVPVAETEWGMVTTPDAFHAYIVQERVPGDTLLPKVILRSSEDEAVALLSQVLDCVDACVGAGIGIDPQLSNWSVREGRPLLLDVTTPMLRDAEGRDLLDTELFVAMLPVVMRGLVRRFLIEELLDKNFEKRGILLDLIGNIVNYDLGHLTGAFLPIVNARLDKPIEMKELKSYRRAERWTWAAIGHALKIEQAWKRRFVKDPSLHLLPSEFA